MSNETPTTGSERAATATASTTAQAPAEERPLFDPAIIANANLLLVDDESLITTSLRHFFELELGLTNVITFNSSVEAIAWARANRVDMTISDFLMPEIDGIALLAEMKKLHPEATRVLLTGYADKANAIRAINEVGLFQYIEKPWDSDRLGAVVRSGLEHMALQRTLRLMVDKLSLEHNAREDLRRALLRTFA